MASTEPSHVMCAHDKAGVPNEAKKRLYREGKVLFDGGIGPHFTWQSAPNKDGEVSLERMHKLRRDGGLVYLRANQAYPSYGKIGYVEPGTPVKTECIKREEKEDTWLKTLQVAHIVEFHERDETGLLDVDQFRPGQFTVHNVDEYREKVIGVYINLWGSKNFPWEN